MYPVAKNYFGGFIQAHSFSGYVPTFAFLDHVEMKDCSKPLTHPECRPQHQKQAAARGSSKASGVGATDPLPHKKKYKEIESHHHTST